MEFAYLLLYWFQITAIKIYPSNSMLSKTFKSIDLCREENLLSLMYFLGTKYAIAN